MIHSLLSHVRTDLAVTLVMLIALLTHPHEIIGFVCDLLGWP